LREKERTKRGVGSTTGERGENIDSLSECKCGAAVKEGEKENANLDFTGWEKRTRTTGKKR